MNNRLFIFLLFLGSAVLSYGQSDPFKKTIKYEDYETLVNKKDDVLYVVNFWATWCGPCVEELPEFMEVNREFSGRKDFKMILISLDNKRDLDEGVKPFLKQKNISADVYLLDDVKRMNFWIPKTDRTWGGSIPATALYRNGKKLQFIEKQLQKEDLLQIINQYLKL